jgi:hypothetical protein
VLVGLPPRPDLELHASTVGRRCSIVRPGCHGKRVKAST